MRPASALLADATAGSRCSGEVSPGTIARLERGESLRERTVDAIRAALEKAGVVFIAENCDGPGVRLKRGA